jgi:diguanylate cyclase (GGDEF)-like protein/PAS domain S-box-containing protein
MQIPHDDHYKSIFDHTMGALLHLAPDGSVSEANPAACRLFGFSEPELLRMCYDDLISGDHDTLHPMFEEGVRAGEVTAELQCRRSDGSSFPALVLSSSYFDHNRDLWSVLLVRDLSTIKEVERRWIEAHEEWRQIALYDPITGILNRRGFLEQCSRELSRAARNRYPVCLLMIDFDHFKKMNDTYGHQIGDKLLERLTEEIRDAVRPYDCLGRFGGDEFVICLPQVALESGIEIAERLRRRVEKQQFPILEHILGVTMSIGIACRVPKRDTTVESLLSEADRYMYRAKVTRNAVFHPSMEKSPQENGENM